MEGGSSRPTISHKSRHDAHLPTTKMIINGSIFVLASRSDIKSCQEMAIYRHLLSSPNLNSALEAESCHKPIDMAFVIVVTAGQHSIVFHILLLPRKEAIRKAF